MTFRHNQRRDAGSRDSGAHGVSLLIRIDSMVPSPSGFGRREHSSASAHVAVSGLARTVGPAASDARNTGDGTASAPGSGRCLMTGFTAHLERRKRKS